MCVLMTLEGPLKEVDSMTSGQSVPCRSRHFSASRPISFTAFSKHSMKSRPMIFIYMYTCIMPTYIPLSLYIYIYICIYIYIYTYIHLRFFSSSSTPSSSR